MFNWFNNLKIRSKLLVAFIVIISLTIIISVIDLFSQHYIQNTTTDLIDIYEQISELSLKSSNAMLMARRNEKDYLLRYKQIGFTKARAKYVTNVQNYIANIHEYINKIKQIETHTDDLAIITTIKQNLNKYESTFLIVIDLFEERGFQDIGLEGEFRNSVHLIENSIKINKLDQLTIDMLTMRRHEKDYLLRNREKYVNQLNKTIINFKTNVAATSLNKIEKEQLIIQVTQYQTKFMQLVKIEQQIATSIEVYRNAVHGLEAPLEQMLTNGAEQKKLARIHLQEITRLTFISIISISLLVVIVGLLIAFTLANLFSKPLVLIAQGSKLLSEGNITLTGIDSAAITKLITHKDEIGEIAQTFNALANYFQEVVKDIVQVSKGLAEGNYVTTKVEYRGDFSQIKNSLEIAITKLSDATIKNKAQDWLKSGQSQLNEQIAGEQEILTMSKKIISFLTTYIEAQVGLFYILTNEYLQIIASYAYIDNDESPDKIPITKGLAGQAALERKVISITQTSEECLPITRSGLASSLPKHILLLPFLYEDNLKGVIEIGSSVEISDIQRNFLEQVMPNIGIAVNTAESRTKMQALLEQSQQQSEELQEKQKEMQQTNEELQSQSEELQAQSEEMQSQQEELRQTNEILEERTRGLEQQKSETQEKNRILENNRIEMEKAQVEMEKAQAAIILKAEELELASKYKSEFLANMSHELRTPLNSLLILAKLLADNKPGTLNEKQVEYAQTINSAGKDLLTLINDILDLSKVEAGKIEVQWENVLLSELLTKIGQKFKPIAEDKELEFTTSIDLDINQSLRTDSQRLKQIINNLLSNAFKFTTKGSVKIIVQHPTEIPSSIEGNKLILNKTIAINVKDTGIGIPKDKQQAIFEAFQQADGSTSRKYGGTGLGLSISRQLSRLLGGELTLTSDDKGSIFTLYLPESTPKSTITQIEPALEKPLLNKGNYSPSIPLPKLQPIPDDRDNLQSGDKTILFIEDDRKFSSILTDLSNEKGFKHLLAEDGITGVQLAKQYKPSAIILDVGLPELNGWSVMERLKDNPETRHIPVHFMSASDQSMDAKKMGAIGYLLKPVSMEKLTDAFKRIEHFLTRTVKKLLIVTDVELHKKKIIELVNEEGIQIQQEAIVESAFQNLQTVTYDCIILDIDTEQGSGSHLLEMMNQDRTNCQVPIIVYAERDLTIAEETLLMRCSDAIPIKSVNSPERLLDEATLFLHQIEAKLPDDKRDMLHMVHDKEAILKNKKVLIVDDDVRNVFALATILEENNMETICAINGQEGLELLELNNDTAIVLMDIMMPEMDGYEAMREIRKQPKHHKLPIISLTAKAMKDDKAKCIEAGANDYLAKPVDDGLVVSVSFCTG